MQHVSDRRPSRRSFLATAGAGVAAASFGSVTRARAATLQPLSFQLSWVKSIQYGGYFAGIDRGTFHDMGVDPTFVSGGPNIDAVANVATGRSQLGDRPVGSILIARDKGIPVKVIGTVFERSPYSILSLASKPITAVSQLKGKTVAVAIPTTPLFQNVLREGGVDPASVNIVPSSPDPSALAAGAIDALCAYSTDEGVMLQTRGVKIYALNMSDLGLPETAGTIYGTESFLEANRDLVVRFLRAASLSWSWALSHPEATAHFMVDKYGVPGLSYAAQLTEIKVSQPYIDTGIAKTKGLLSLDLGVYDKVIAAYRKAGMIKSDVTAATLCDASFVNAAHRA
jgi:ABC-type nitrate/sulfonate/bicarbonate transport system substrate-binding protein